MDTWEPYERQFGRMPDFLVRYRFLTFEEGGRQSLPFQGYRSDLRYKANHKDNDVEFQELSMVWPEFLLPDGTVGTETLVPVSESGTAYMWICNPHHQLRARHKRLAIPGRHCWFMEGNRKVAECTVIEQIGLIHET